MKKSKLALGIAAATLATVAVTQSTVAEAHKRSRHHTHHKHHARAQHHSYQSSGDAVMASKVEVLESQLRAVQDELASLRAAGGGATGTETAKVQELDAWMQEQKAKPAGDKDNMVFFRGGYARNDQRPIATTSNLIGTCLVNCESSDKDGWYFGAGFDFSLDDDLFGLMNNTEVLAELAFDYNEFGRYSSTVTNAIPGVPTTNFTATQSQLRLTAAPKIKLFKGSKLRPWIIPVGFTLNVMSPPSQVNTITHLMPAMHFGGGVDYNIWRNLYVGVDARYTWAFNKLDASVNVNGLQGGGYIGIGF